MCTQSSNLTLYHDLCEVIPGGVNSPVRAFKGLQQSPMIVDRAEKDLIYDADGNAFIDYCGSWGPLIHGHAHPEILQAVQKRMARGTTFGVTSVIEEKLARKIVQLVPSIEKIRFVSSGTEAAMSAARLARGFTGRDLLVKFTGNYHGHADFFLVQAGSGVIGLTPTSSSAGIPEDVIRHTACLPYNDVHACRDFFHRHATRDRIAAVIVEPIAGNMGCVPATQEFINLLRKETNDNGALLIFDEVITGFRVGLGGAQALYRVKPDLTCLGKIVGGGLPAAAFGGRREIMDLLAPSGPVYQAGTLSGNPLAMEAGLQTISLLERRGFYEELERKTKILTDPIADFLKKKNLNACLQRVQSMFTIFFGRRQVSSMEEALQLDLDGFGRFFRYLYAHGIYIPPSQYESWFVSTAHEESHLEKTRDLIINFLGTQ
jgi:glutamate-1-semialdehyde 2,1-aminomutase